MADKTNQEQTAAGGSIAIQSGHNTVVHVGIGLSDMKQIIEAIAAQLPSYAALAGQIVDARLKDFEQRVLERFTNSESSRAEAFKDPDFQYLIGRAQHAYARSGNETVRDALIDLIAQRSKLTERNRLALSLNEAVEKAALLTANEFAELSLAYLFKYTITNGIGDLNALAHILRINVVPLLKDISEEAASYSYLEAQACANIQITQNDIGPLFRDQYGGVLAKGFDQESLKNHLPDGQKDVFDRSNLIISCLNDPMKLQFCAQNKSEFQKEAASLGLTESALNNVWNMFSATMWSDNEIIQESHSIGPRNWRSFPPLEGYSAQEFETYFGGPSNCAREPYPNCRLCG